MPTTINGVGTHYYGKSNISTRSGVCDSCGKAAALISYDTRLWIVVIYIPLIPIGRKRIIDYCPHCTRHRAANADEFAASRKREIDRARETFNADPTPEAALQLHLVMLVFGDHAQAAELRREQQPRYAGNAQYLLELAGHLEEVQQNKEALQLYHAAYLVDPELPLARLGAGKLAMLEGQLSESRKILSFLEQPGAGADYSMGPLLELAEQFQQQGQHDVTLQLTGVALRELPELGQQHVVRKLVRASEQQVGGFDSQLPAPANSLFGKILRLGPAYPGWQRWALAGSVLAALVMGGALYSNSRIGNHRKLYVTNAFDQPVHVQVDDQPPVAVTGLGTLPIAEGKHRIHLTGAVEETHDVELASGFFERWTSEPAWVLNPGAAAVFVESRITYAMMPTPPVEQVIAGESFFYRPHVDYRFNTAPAQLQVENSKKQVVKVQLEWKSDTGMNAFNELVALDLPAAIRFAETSLRRNPDQSELLQNYANIGPQHLPVDQALAFLRAGVERTARDGSPANLDWQRFYQTYAEDNGQVEMLLAEYDKLLVERPNDGTLLYLRGHIEPDWPRQREYYQQAIAAAPDLGWPHYALAYNEASQGHWTAADEHLKAAERLNVEPAALFAMRQPVRLGAGNLESLIQANQELFAKDRTEFSHFMALGESLVAAGEEDELNVAINSWQAAMPEDARQVLGPLALGSFAYMRGDHAAGLAACTGGDQAVNASLQTHLLLAANDFDAAVAFAEANQQSIHSIGLLAVAIACDRAGQQDQAKLWRTRCLESLSDAPRNQLIVVDLLRSGEPPEIAKIERMQISAENKALLFAGWGLQFPDRREDYFAAARRFNIRRIPPYHMVRQIVETAETAETTDE